MKGSSSIRKSWLLRGGLLVGGLLFLYVVPLFHVVPLKATREESAKASFDADQVIETFWNDRLRSVSAEAVDLDTLRAALRADPKGAIERFGHRLGMSTKSSFFVAGSGTIEEVTNRAIEISLSEGGTVSIRTGPVFGNTLRDATGVFNVSDYSNSQEFNALSTEINRRVEERVIPGLREMATKGKRVRFAGAFELTDSNPIVEQVKLVPVGVEFP